MIINLSDGSAIDTINVNTTFALTKIVYKIINTIRNVWLYIRCCMITYELIIYSNDTRYTITWAIEGGRVNVLIGL